MFRDSFGRGVKMGPTFTDFFVCKIYIIIWTSHPHVSYIWSPSPSALVGAPKYFWFHQFMACIVMRISWPNYEKSVEKGHLFENSYAKSPPPPTQVVGPRGTQMILISSVYGGVVAPSKYFKSPFWKISAWYGASPGARFQDMLETPFPFFICKKLWGEIPIFANFFSEKMDFLWSMFTSDFMTPSLITS